ncbi:diguanylate cyclase [Thermomonas sp.]|uniref:GGDEF domain-containing protein n=1 Tax=Thermomonas sp. TaxID=1971895 RepID=UPI001B3D6EB2|nr:diguanylate cyclase [Thermomonas sp.]MBK6923687.1 diguanylate cyclase [Thermomonas sp.]MBL0229024.1 diguanylate cyclase [Thermomonas sp.]MBP7157927.1 diguanylate cyclase [Thermomonas sp.]MBP7789474.1 diguanylate cyclase [Thermomonas sp.]HQW59973.1 diguanylate cyclase [Thermomonas sp.]
MSEPVGLPWEGQDTPARRATLTRILVRIAREALQGADLDSLLQGICECLVAELPVAIASVILLDEANQSFVHEVYDGEWTQSPLAVAGDWPVTRGAAGRCARLGTAQLITDVDADPDYVAGNVHVRSEYLVPIRHGQRLHGVLNIESTRSDFFDEEARAVFDAVADLVAGAIHFARMADDLQQANRKLEQLSMIDGLTGIANRRRFDQQLCVDWRRMAAEGRPLALLMVDADAFKPLNDAAGHLYGDECLRELARICNGFADGDNDLVGRFGGEELVLLLPGRDLAAATAIAEALRIAVEAQAMPHPASPVSAHVTVSVGVAVAVPAAARPPERLIAAADRAMYAAKLQGRNRVCVAGAES